MKSESKPTTRISTSTVDRIFVRDKDLVQELIGRLTFTEMAFFQIMGRIPTKGETRILDAVLVTRVLRGGRAPKPVDRGNTARSAGERSGAGLQRAAVTCGSAR